MSLPTDNRFTPTTVGTEDGDGLNRGGLAVLDLSRYQDPEWCANCGGEQTFVPVDRFPCGWRGYCLGCGDVKYVMDERTSSEAA